MPFFAVEVKFTGWEKDGLLEQKRNGKWNNNNNNNNSNINRTKSHAAQHSCFTLNEWCPVSSWAAAPSLLFPQFIYWAWHHMVWNIPLASWGQLFCLTVLPTSLLDGGVVWEAEKPDSQWTLLSETQPSECYQYFSPLWSKTQYHTSY